MVSPLRNFFVVLAVFAANSWFATEAVRAQAPVSASTGDQRIRQALEEPTSFEFIETPLQALIDAPNPQMDGSEFVHLLLLYMEIAGHAPIEVVGVWDTVKALGLRLPLLWMLTEKRTAFHSPYLGRSIRHGFHALALNETRAVFEPVMWVSPPDWTGNVEQVWFRGAHGDIGGQLGNFEAARPLANIPLVWMLAHAETCGLVLPSGWRDRFPCDPRAPMVGTMRGFGAAFILRRARRIGQDRSEHIHPSAVEAEPDRWLPKSPARARRA